MSFTDKQIYDLNNMNVAAQNVELGQYLQDLSNIDNIQHGGKLNPFKDTSSYKENYDAYKGKDMYIAIDGGEYTDGALDIPNMSQNDENPPKLHLTITNAKFNGATASGKNIYVTNAQELIIKNCVFQNNDVSDYAVDVNLCTIQDAVIIIENCSFIKTGTKAAVKISQRKGETDHPDDITVTTPATIASVTIKNCSFDGNVVDYNCGTTPKGEDTNANLTTGHYPMYIESNVTDMRIAMPYLVDKDVDAPVFVAKAGDNYYKSPDGEF